MTNLSATLSRRLHETPASTANMPHDGRCRVLVFDDDDRFAELVATMLDASDRLTLLARLPGRSLCPSSAIGVALTTNFGGAVLAHDRVRVSNCGCGHP
jgi:hypothetical protein